MNKTKVFFVHKMIESNQKYGRNVTKELLFSENTETVCNSLLEITFNDPDWQWKQDVLLNLLENNDNLDVKRLAITCLGHLARIHRQLDKNKVMPVLEKYLSNTELGGTVSDAFDDFEMFLDGKN